MRVLQHKVQMLLLSALEQVHLNKVQLLSLSDLQLVKEFKVYLQLRLVFSPGSLVKVKHL